MINSKLIAVGVLAVGLLMVGTIVFKSAPNSPEKSARSNSGALLSKIDPAEINQRYRFNISLGNPGSEHSHMTLAFFLDDERIDFSQTKYQLRAPHVHFEGGEGSIIHKHAVGVNLPFFFSTLGIRINQDCFSFDGITEYCANDSKKLSFIINGKKMDDIFSYELRDKDKILINYGSDTESELMAKFNDIPVVPEIRKTENEES